MERDKRYELNRSLSAKHILQRMKYGIVATFTNPVKLLFLAIVSFAIIFIWQSRYEFFNIHSGSLLANINELLFDLAYIVCSIAVVILTLIVFGMPQGCISIENNLRRIGLINRAGEAPFLVKRYRDKTNTKVTIFDLETYGIPLKEWEDNRTRLESSLNVFIPRIKQGKNNRHILLYTVPASAQLPEKINWRSPMLRNKNFELILGKSYIGDVVINLNLMPHLLIGGSTGSGKTVLLRHLLMQCKKKGAKVIIADFKGGIDYKRVWVEQCEFITDEDTLLSALQDLVSELNRRKMILLRNECENIDVYNKRFPIKIRRIIFSCDEVAELFARSGLSKVQKDRIYQIEGLISTIARLGRAFGIHLILATQRPDANILSGQIKNNMDCRICGKADNVLSMIILDNTNASEMIPKDAQGLFLLYDGTLFKGYLFDERKELSDFDGEDRKHVRRIP